MSKKRDRGVMRSDGRITIPAKWRKELGLEEDAFYEIEVYGKDKILVTFLTVRRE